MIKVEGFDASFGGYLMKLKSADAQHGGFVQAGYLVVPKHVHVAGRFAAHQAGTDDYLLEGRAAFTYLFNGHALKIASDVGFLKLTGSDHDAELQIRIMPQLTF